MTTHVLANTTRSVNALNKRINGTAPVLVLFWAQWCPHCVSMKPEWGELKARMGGTNLSINEIEHSVLEFIRSNNLAPYANVFGYPTIIMFSNQGRSQYLGPRDAASMEAWVRGFDVKPVVPRRPRSARPARAGAGTKKRSRPPTGS